MQDRPSAQPCRRHGLDWLRVGAFGLLILYHIGMVFVPWDYHIKVQPTLSWLEPVMLLVNPWRLSLLFLIAGVASATMASRLEPGDFTRRRSARLGLPLLFGAFVIVPPQSWVELVVKTDYEQSYLSFLSGDYVAFSAELGIILPTYNHLWFVAYLLVYTWLAATILAAVPASWRDRLRAAVSRALDGWRLFALPVLWLLAARVLLYPAFGSTHALVDDWYNHAVYLFMFAIGIALAHAPNLWRSMARLWRPAAVLAVAGYGGVMLFRAVAGADPAVWSVTAGRLALAVQAWGAILALLGWAEEKLRRPSPALVYLTQAVFPYYIVHQTVIILTAYWLRPLDLSLAAQFAVITAATVTGCGLSFEVVRRVSWLRPLFGLKGPSTAGPTAVAQRL